MIRSAVGFLLLAVFLRGQLPVASAQQAKAEHGGPATAGLRALSGAEFKKFRDSGTPIDLIDVRVPGDYRRLHLVGARNVPFYLIGRAALPEKRSIVIYCSGLQCKLGPESALTLLRRGYKDVQVLDGGLEAALAAGCSVEGEGAARPARRVMKTAELAAGLASGQPPVVLDVRSPAAFAAGHLPGAFNHPLEKLERLVPELPADRIIVLYDSSADRAGRAAGLLGGGRRAVWELEGGLALWAREGRSLVSGLSMP